ncbi:GDSL-type esterase/lipase family protein [Kitasatospora sp. NPDC088346]|uniref:GDSL-type esterase/lipase family protein n=1 Tax=Kitasatospora sp. NPDC088346 TaxID=3364073 RepID=UPI0037F14606
MNRTSVPAASRRRARLIATALALPLAAAGQLAVALPAHADTKSAVAMGDSFVSGEGGRCKGNSDTFTGSRAGTDRAYSSGTYDAARVYGASYAGGCDRSDSAEVTSAFGTAKAVNLACSGAKTTNVFRADHGGRAFKGEKPQADQLAAVAAKRTVGLVVLSVGGNDLGFSDIIAGCVKSYETWSSCRDDQQEAVDSRIDAAMENVGKSIDEIRAVMDRAGYRRSAYRIVLQSYPSPIPRAAENRYPASGWRRTNDGGCPVGDGDANWARDSLVPQMSGRLADVAADRGVQFLDLQDLLQGHEVCSSGASLATSSHGPSESGSEWARFLTTGLSQGTRQESMHPNYYGQLALGRCLSLINARPAGRNYTCHNTPGRTPPASTSMNWADTTGGSAADRARSPLSPGRRP